MNDGVDNLTLYQSGVVGLADIHQIGGKLGDTWVILDIRYGIKILVYAIKFQMLTSNLRCIVPNIHHNENSTCQKDGEPSAMSELKKIGGKERALYSNKYSCENEDKHFADIL